MQLEFDFSPKRRRVDYDALYERLKEGEVTVSEIQEMTGVDACGVSQVVTTLSLRFPVWTPRRGVYKLLEDSDGDDGRGGDWDGG